MAVGVIWYPQIDRQAYDDISGKVMQAGAEKGMRFHAAGEGDGGWRIVEVWESREGFERFVEEDLAAAFREQAGESAPTPQPEVVFDIVAQGP